MISKKLLRQQRTTRRTAARVHAPKPRCHRSIEQAPPHRFLWVSYGRGAFLGAETSDLILHQHARREIVARHLETLAILGELRVTNDGRFSEISPAY